MTARSELTASLLSALREIPGLRAATPSTTAAASAVPWDLDVMAVDISEDVVEIRVVALEVPIPPLTEVAGTALRAVLTGTPWENASLRLVVTDVDAAALVP
ncbi:hypothetical protein ACFQ73_20105 [Amycolatopsis japonica]|uniref:hypothetical protein n=1 Tax=Amycolatopsis japonica TaxID=208439 RepID=UPI00366B4BD0